ncbi:hypothetical protein LLG07_06650 [bacterium]|nr:hypothetical protein [bacterium]
MRIDFHKLIKQSGEKLTKADLAREMVAKGIFRNQVSAYQMLQYHERGEAKSIDYELLKFLMQRFNLKLQDVITDIYK